MENVPSRVRGKRWDCIKEEDDDAKEDIFQVLDRQRKEQKWRKFKTKLHLTNWVEDLILDRFSDYDQQLKLEKEE
mgnify:CR=1 FL=1